MAATYMVDLLQCFVACQPTPITCKDAQVYLSNFVFILINEAILDSLYRSAMGTLVAVFLSIVGQLVMTVLFAQEAITTKESNFNRIKSTLASLLYLSMAVLLSWLLVSKGIFK